MIDKICGTIHHFSSGVYAKEMHLAWGTKATSHKHLYDHFSILAKGKVIVNDQIFCAPACIEIKAGQEHEITALEDSVWFCIHATDVTDIEKIDDVLIQKV